MSRRSSNGGRRGSQSGAVARTRTFSTAPKCKVCEKSVYPQEQIVVEATAFHKNCLRCKVCNKVLTISSFSKNGDEYFCKPHLKQLFYEKGNYDEGFGRQTRAKSWGPDQLRAMGFTAPAADGSGGTDLAALQAAAEAEEKAMAETAAKENTKPLPSEPAKAQDAAPRVAKSTPRRNSVMERARFFEGK